MSKPDLKALQELAKACRKAGIKSYKGDGIEFTLSDEPPVSNYKRAKAPQMQSQTEKFESDSLTQDELLFWSTGEIPDESST